MKITDLYESDFLTDENEILQWMNQSFIEFNPHRLTIESEGLIYDYNLDLRMVYPENKLKVQFKKIDGYFNFNGANIITLEGSPETVKGFFNCKNTKITSLKDCPKSVSGTFYCRNVKITDPKEYRYALYSEIGGKFRSDSITIDNIINTYSGSNNRKYWPHAINLLSRVKL